MCAFPKIRKEKSIHSVNGLDLTDKKFITIKQITHICCLRTVRSRYEVYRLVCTANCYIFSPLPVH